MSGEGFDNRTLGQDAWRTALTAAGLNLLATTVKFAVWFFTGSLTVEAEAFHSLADVGTSLLVTLSLYLADGWPGRLTALLPPASALAVSLLLFHVGTSVAAAGMYFRQLHTRLQLAGAATMFLSAMLSYSIYKLEKMKGEQLGSLALVSDACHARLDTLGAMIAASSLVGEHFGLALDSPMAILLGTIVSLEAAELALKSSARIVLLVVGEDGEAEQRTHMGHWLSLSLTETLIVTPLGGLHELLLSAGGNIPWKTALPLLLPLFLAYSCMVEVDPWQQAVVVTLGRMTRTATSPGLLLSPPPPLAEVEVVDTARIRSFSIGYEGEDPLPYVLWTKRHVSREIDFLSGDGEFVTMYMTVHYHVKDVRSFLFTAREPGAALKALASALLVEELATCTFFEAALERREELASVMESRLQALADSLELGLRIDHVGFRDIHPPIQAAASFEAVISAEELKEARINRAGALRARMLPLAEAEALRREEAARGEAAALVEKAEGELESFRLLRPKETPARKSCMYLMRRRVEEATLPRTRLIILGADVPPPEIVFMDADGNGEGASR